MPTIRVLPLDRTLTAAPGEPLRDALQRAGIALDYPCGGKGECRQCRVAIDPAPSSGTGTLPGAETVR